MGRSPFPCTEAPARRNRQPAAINPASSISCESGSGRASCCSGHGSCCSARSSCCSGCGSGFDSASCCFRCGNGCGFGSCCFRCSCATVPCSGPWRPIDAPRTTRSRSPACGSSPSSRTGRNGGCPVCARASPARLCPRPSSRTFSPCVLLVLRKEKRPDRRPRVLRASGPGVVSIRYSPPFEPRLRLLEPPPDRPELFEPDERDEDEPPPCRPED